MNITPIINQLFSLFFYLVPLVLVVGLFKTSWFKGFFGEFQVNLLLTLFLSNKTFSLIKNVTLRTDNGTTQIDQVVVSKYGVFVIETKNMKGGIFGSANQKQWTQKIAKRSNKFQNPIHQNYKHLKALESCLNIPSDGIFSVIVFIGDSTFKTNMPKNVTYAGGCIDYIKSKKTEIFTPKQVRKMIKGINSGRLKPGLKTNLDHIVHVKQAVKEKETGKPCPKCNSYMVIRQSKKSANAGNKFWGCSTYPKCRAIVNVHP